LAEIKAKIRKWPIDGSFRIAHDSVTEIEVVEVKITHNGSVGRGECRPYLRYGETPQSVLNEIEEAIKLLPNEPDTNFLQNVMPAGAARNAIDCALWDLKAKSENKRIWEILGIPASKPRPTAFTLSIDTPMKMARAAKAAKAYPILKLKIEGIRGLDACIAVMDTRPDAQLIIDANESLSPDELEEFRVMLEHYPVLMIEQPLKQSEFNEIDNTPNQLPILCADESLHTCKDLQELWDAGYRAVNVKLDKSGGITEAISLITEAKRMGFVVMAGCMVGTSLAMAPMMAISTYADVLDLDGPLLLAKDIGNGLKYDGPIVYPPSKKLWG